MKRKFIKDHMSIALAREEFHGHDNSVWSKEYFDEKSGGYVVVHRQRIKHSKINKTERAKYEKEFYMAKIFAQNGYRVEMLQEIIGYSSPDVTINGILADLKRTEGINNIVKYARKAIRRQGAEIVLFQFDNNSAKLRLELLELKSGGYKALYFFTGKNKVYEI